MNVKNKFKENIYIEREASYVEKEMCFVENYS